MELISNLAMIRLPPAPDGRHRGQSARFEEAYPDFTGDIAGEYVGALDNNGEKIEIADALGQDYRRIQYTATTGSTSPMAAGFR